MVEAKTARQGHTPGPWEACDRGDYGDYDGDCIVILGDDRRIAVVLGTDEEARLIMAAPELLAACKEVVESGCEGFCKDFPPGYYEPDMSIDCGACKCRAAIAKAEPKP